MEAEYVGTGHNKELVLRIKASDMEKRIPIDEVGKWACDHDYLVSDCGRCWDCGCIRVSRHPPMNWAIPKKVAD